MCADSVPLLLLTSRAARCLRLVCVFASGGFCLSLFVSCFFLCGLFVAGCLVVCVCDYFVVLFIFAWVILIYLFIFWFVHVFVCFSSGLLVFECVLVYCFVCLFVYAFMHLFYLYVVFTFLMVICLCVCVGKPICYFLCVLFVFMQVFFLIVTCLFTGLFF